MDRFYRNLGTDADGRPRFEDATAAAGLAAAHGPGLGVVAADFDGDRLSEIYVANDAADNQWWVPRAGDPGAPAGFRDDAPMAGCAVNGAGQREASMGAAVGDLDGDLDLDLFLTHLDGESHTLYDNRGGHFADVTRARGLETPTWPHTGFGTGAVDVDNDGRLDLLVVHGAVKRFSEARTETADGVPTLGQPNHLLRQGPDGVFEDVSLRGGPAFALAEVSRGAAFADYDDDGDLDVLITNNDGPARLLENRVGQDHPWIGLDLRTQGGGAADGAVVLVTCGDGARFLRRAARDGSYASANDPRILVGLGGGSGPCGAEIRWPDGSTESFADLVAGRYHRLEQGSGDSSSGRPGDSNAS
ncbi:MAG: FG-GAP-like repeat-containing protein [Acidobacteriota bacterium]